MDSLLKKLPLAKATPEQLQAFEKIFAHIQPESEARARLASLSNATARRPSRPKASMESMRAKGNTARAEARSKRAAKAPHPAAAAARQHLGKLKTVTAKAREAAPSLFTRAKAPAVAAVAPATPAPVGIPAAAISPAAAPGKKKK